MTEDDQQEFELQNRAFRLAFARAQHASNSVANRLAFQRFWIVSVVFARMCLLAKSITILLDEYPRRHSTIDHGAIGMLGRGVLEHQVLIGYVCEKGISKAEWQLRKWTFDIHDVVSRIRLQKGIGNSEAYRKAKDTLPEFAERLKAHTLFGSLPNEIKDEILKGQRIYVRGIRNAAKIAGWNPKEWDAIYTYLSGQGHAAPLSFYYYREQNVDHLSISKYQRGYIALVLQLVGSALDSSTKQVEAIFCNESENYPTDE